MPASSKRPPYHRGQIVEVDLGGAEAAVVVSESHWNTSTHSPVVVPLYTNIKPNVLRPRIPRIGVADCTRPITMQEKHLGKSVGRWSPPVEAAVRLALRAMLNIDTLISGAVPTPPPASSAPWFPRFGDIHYSLHPLAGESKMFVIVSDDAWNQRHAFALGVRLTSKTKPWRLQWEVPLPGGPAVVGDLVPLVIAQLNPRAPQHPRPKTTDQRERHAVGRGLKLVLNL